jgi:hypothetical protein
MANDRTSATYSNESGGAIGASMPMANFCSNLVSQQHAPVPKIKW